MQNGNMVFSTLNYCGPVLSKSIVRIFRYAFLSSPQKEALHNFLNGTVLVIGNDILIFVLTIA